MKHSAGLGRASHWSAEYLHSVIPEVRYDNIRFRRESEAMGVIQLPVPIPLGAELAQEAAVTGEQLDPVVVTVRYDDHSVVRDSHSGGSKKLPVPTPLATKIEHEPPM